MAFFKFQRDSIFAIKIFKCPSSVALSLLMLKNYKGAFQDLWGINSSSLGINSSSWDNNST